jgi:hypothetical protein
LSDEKIGVEVSNDTIMGRTQDQVFFLSAKNIQPSHRGSHFIFKHTQFGTLSRIGRRACQTYALQVELKFGMS